MGFGSASGITTCDVLAMARAFGFDPARFLRSIRAIDAVFLQHLHKAAEKKTGAK